MLNAVQATVERLDRLSAVGDPVGRMAGVGQGAAQGLSHHPVVFDKQQSHGRKPDPSSLGAHECLEPVRSSHALISA